MAIAYFRKLRGVPADAWRLIPVIAMFNLSYFGVFAVAFSLYLLRMGYRPAFVGQANATGNMVYALGMLPAGLLARRWSPRRMMLLGVLVETGTMVLLGMADLIPVLWRSGWIIGAEVLLGLSVAIWAVNFHPVLMVAAGPEARDQAFGLAAAVGGLAILAGSLLGGWLPGLLAQLLGTTLSDPIPFRWTLVAGATVTLLRIPPMLRCEAVRTVWAPEQTERHSSLPVVPIVAMFLFALLLHIAGATLSNFRVVYMDMEIHASSALIGALGGFASVLGIPASLSVPWFTSRWGRPGSILRLSVVAALGFALIAGVAHWAGVAAGLMVLALVGIRGTILLVYSLEAVETEWRPTMNGALGLATGVGMGIAGFLGGPIIQAWGYRALFGLAGILAAAMGPGLWAYDRVRGRARPATTTEPGAGAAGRG